jgi:hypothetical protein
MSQGQIHNAVSAEQQVELIIAIFRAALGRHTLGNKHDAFGDLIHTKVQTWLGIQCLIYTNAAPATVRQDCRSRCAKGTHGSATIRPPGVPVGYEHPRSLQAVEHTERIAEGQRLKEDSPSRHGCQTG